MCSVSVVLGVVAVDFATINTDHDCLFITFNDCHSSEAKMRNFFFLNFKIYGYLPSADTHVRVQRDEPGNVKNCQPIVCQQQTNVLLWNDCDDSRWFFIKHTPKPNSLLKSFRFFLYTGSDCVEQFSCLLYGIWLFCTLSMGKILNLEYYIWKICEKTKKQSSIRARSPTKGPQDAYTIVHHKTLCDSYSYLG